MNQQTVHPHLVIIAHGSRSMVWNAAIETFTESAREINKKNGAFFSDVSCSYLEHAIPSIPDALQELSQSSNSIVAVPFFLAPGVHVQKDVPALIKSVGSVQHESESGLCVQCGETSINLIPHYSETDLLAQNALHRMNQHSVSTNPSGLILVYYGSKRHPEVWERLVKDIEAKIKCNHALVMIHSIYAGDAVDFSPQPVMDAISVLADQCNSILILPMLLSVGIIQTQVIPQAIQRSKCLDKVIYHQDAVLPDDQIAEEIWIHAKKQTIDNVSV